MWFEAKGWLPEKDGLYLCWHKDWSMEVVRYRKSIPGIDGFNTMGAGGNLPMFWMPLPKAPTAEIREVQPETAGLPSQPGHLQQIKAKIAAQQGALSSSRNIGISTIGINEFEDFLRQLSAID
jgi:hypothetical protein